MFQISHLVKEFNSVHAVHDVTTQICQGEVVFVVGPSGSCLLYTSDAADE